MRVNEGHINRLNPVSVRSIVEATDKVITDIRNSTLRLDDAAKKLLSEMHNFTHNIMRTDYLFDSNIEENLQGICVKSSIIINKNYIEKFNNLFVALHNKIKECLRKHNAKPAKPYR